MTKLTDRRIDYLLSARFRLTPQQREQARLIREFARTRLGIELHVGQLAFAGLVLSRDERRIHNAEFMTLLLAAGNRAGKTAMLAVIIIYCCLDKTNKPKPVVGDDAVRWLRSEYHWYHFGISQEVADLVYNDIVRIFSGTHDGQANGCPMAEYGAVADWATKEYGDYRWVRFKPDWGGAEVHFRTTGEKALGSLGKDMHGVSFDEAGIERNLPFLMKEVFNMRRLGTGGQLLLASTPSEDLGSDFADMWEYGNPEARKRLRGWRSIRMSTRDNVGYGLEQYMFDRLIEDMDDRTIRQNIDGEFLQSKAAYFNGSNVEACFVDGMPEQSTVKPFGVYLQGLDPAKSADSAWSIVLKVVQSKECNGSGHIEGSLVQEREHYCEFKPYLVGVYAKQEKGQKSTDTLVLLAADAYNEFARQMTAVTERGSVNASSTCYTATDATGFGGKMFREAIEHLVPNLTNVEFGGSLQKKRMLLGDLRTLIDEGRLLLPSDGVWREVRKQLLAYKLEDRKLTQDAVMALVCAVHLLRRTAVGDHISVPFDASGAA